MANKTLNVTVKLDSKAAEASLDRLSKKINDVQKAINKTSTNNNKLTTAINKAVTSTNKLDTATKKVAATTEKVVKTTSKVNTANNKAVNSARKLAGSYNSGNTAAGKLLKTVKSLSATYLGIMGVRAVLNTSDTITSAENRLNNMEGDNPQLTQTSMDKIYSAAQRSRAGYGDMLNNVSKSMTLAGDSFGGNIDNAIRFQEIMSKAYTVGGASAAEQSSSMYQLIQALGSGVLQGDELRSVREGAPLAYKAIEEFAQGVFNTDESLKELASQGKITSDIVVAAVMDMENGADNINDRFANTAMTFAQAGQLIQNSAIQAFRPVLQMLNDVLKSSMGQAIISGIGQAFVFIANLILWISNLFGTFFNWLAENWNWISRVILSVLAIIGIVMAVLLFPDFLLWLGYMALVIWDYIQIGAAAVASALKTAAAWAIANWQMLLIIVVIAAIVVAIIWLADSFEDACGMIVGVIMTAVAFVWNLIVGVINAIIQFLWTSFVEPWIGIIEWVLNVFNGGFNSFGDGVKNLLGNIISWFLSLGQVVTKIIDAIFGTNWTGGLESLKGKVLEWGKNENAITLSREAPVALDRWAYGDAYDTGYDWGSSGANWVSDKLSGIGDYLKSSNDMNLDVGGSYLPDIDSAANALDPYDFGNIGNDLGDINDNTSAMKDSMDLNSDDLEYLRRIAETEWKKEFTTAEIKVEMNNSNTINGDSDLDGIVTKLTDKLYEELNSVADGVYV